jgi:hypothetical protein
MINFLVRLLKALNAGESALASLKKKNNDKNTTNLPLQKLLNGGEKERVLYLIF